MDTFKGLGCAVLLVICVLFVKEAEKLIRVLFGFNNSITLTDTTNILNSVEKIGFTSTTSLGMSVNSSVVNFGKNVATDPNYLGNQTQKIANKYNETKQAVSNTFNTYKNKAVDTATDIGGKIKDTATGIKDTASNIASGVGEKARGVYDKVLGNDAIDGEWEEIDDNDVIDGEYEEIDDDVIDGEYEKIDDDDVIDGEYEKIDDDDVEVIDDVEHLYGDVVDMEDDEDIIDAESWSERNAEDENIIDAESWSERDAEEVEKIDDDDVEVVDDKAEHLYGEFRNTGEEKQLNVKSLEEYINDYLEKNLGIQIEAYLNNRLNKNDISKEENDASLNEGTKDVFMKQLLNTVDLYRKGETDTENVKACFDEFGLEYDEKMVNGLIDRMNILEGNESNDIKNEKVEKTRDEEVLSLQKPAIDMALKNTREATIDNSNILKILDGEITIEGEANNENLYEFNMKILRNLKSETRTEADFKKAVEEEGAIAVNRLNNFMASKTEENASLLTTSGKQYAQYMIQNQQAQMFIESTRTAVNNTMQERTVSSIEENIQATPQTNNVVGDLNGRRGKIVDGGFESSKVIDGGFRNRSNRKRA